MSGYQECTKKVKQVRKELGMSELKPQKRECLNCPNIFKSSGTSNRLCLACAKRGQYGDTISVWGMFRSRRAAL